MVVDAVDDAADDDTDETEDVEDDDELLEADEASCANARGDDARIIALADNAARERFIERWGRYKVISTVPGHSNSCMRLHC